MNIFAALVFLNAILLVISLVALLKGHESNSFEALIVNKAKGLGIGLEAEEVKHPQEPVSHQIAYELGQALTELPINKSYAVIKDIHPKAAEYYLRTKGVNVKIVDIPERPKLSLVK